ncbi:MAG: hypothetical protein WAW03_20515 [Anaerolineae bacterium]
MSALIIGDLPGTPFVALPATTTVAAARRQAGADRLVVITTAAGLPTGILTQDYLPRLATTQSALTDFAELAFSVTLTTPDTSVETIIRAMVNDKNLRWHVILQEDAIAGVVAPKVLFDAAEQLAGVEALLDALAKGNLNLRNVLPGDPLAPAPSLCYRCPLDTTHRLAPEEVQQRDALHRVRCPSDNSIMVAENPCRTGG